MVCKCSYKFPTKGTYIFLKVLDSKIVANHLKVINDSSFITPYSVKVRSALLPQYKGPTKERAWINQHPNRSPTIPKLAITTPLRLTTQSLPLLVVNHFK